LGDSLLQPDQKPNRNEALEYYRKVAEFYALDVRQYETVERVEGGDGDFTVHTTDRFGRKLEHRARKLVIATGIITTCRIILGFRVRI